MSNWGANHNHAAVLALVRFLNHKRSSNAAGGIAEMCHLRSLGDDMAELMEWESFYVIVGAAAGALIGLQFVVVTLIAERPPLRVAETGAAFATPTIIHFGTALLLSGLLSAPWQTITITAALWGLTGISGIAYSVIVARRMRVQTAYRPEFEDWLFHVLMPLAAYAMLTISAIAAPSHTHEALFGVGAAALLLLFIGIHNAWDTVAYLVFVNKQNTDTDPR